MSSVLVGFDDRGREIHRLREVTPIAASARMNRRTREAGGVDDFGTVEGSTQPMKMHGNDDALAALADEGVPVAGYGDRLPSGGMLGVEVEFPSRRASGRDLTHALLEAADVPLVPRRRGAEEGGTLAGSKFARGEHAQDEDEVWASAEDEDGEAAEDEGAEVDEADEEESEDEAAAHLAAFVEKVAADTHATSRALHLLAAAFRRRRAAIGAAGGLYA